MNNVEDRGRSVELATKYLLPKSSLRSLGKEYGLSFERIRQVVTKVLTVDKLKIKETLKQASSKVIKCVWCGNLIKSTKRRRFCSSRCHLKFGQYDFSEIRVCKMCKGKFYLHLNWKYQGKNTYCSMKCYLNSGTTRISKNWLARVNKKYDNKS